MAETRAENILVFHIGSLGDTLVALPAFWAIKEHFRDSSLVLLTKSGARKGIPVGHDILQGCGIFDDVLLFDGDYHSYGRDLTLKEKAVGAWRLFAELRSRRFDSVVYLAPSARNEAQIRRDLWFFRLCGIRLSIGATVVEPWQDGQVTLGLRRLPRMAREADMIYSRLRKAVPSLPALQDLRRDLALNDGDFQAVDRWLRLRDSDGGRVRVAFGPGSNLQSKLWPLERFEAVGRALIEQADIWPMVFGGPEDVSLGERLIAAWGRGWNAAARFSVRGSAAAMSSCSLYVGNDTGTMHLAASVGIPCVAVFSARDSVGKWDPLGDGHVVLRADVPCAGCMLVRCIEQDQRCLKAIGVEEVVSHALERLIGAQRPGRTPLTA